MKYEISKKMMNSPKLQVGGDFAHFGNQSDDADVIRRHHVSRPT